MWITTQVIQIKFLTMNVEQDPTTQHLVTIIKVLIFLAGLFGGAIGIIAGGLGGLVGSTVFLFAPSFFFGVSAPHPHHTTPPLHHHHPQHPLVRRGQSNNGMGFQPPVLLISIYMVCISNVQIQHVP